jgi:glucosamine-6-phosphate deaminase
VDVRVVAPADFDSIGADVVASALVRAERVDATLMPALGSSALEIYAELGARRAAGSFDTSRLRLIQLDEYVVEEADPRTLIGWLRRDVAAPLGIPKERIVRLDGSVADAAAACAAYDAAVAAAGGIDVAVLGLGPNGHLGFNEPPSASDAATRRVDLTPASLVSNRRYWGIDCPPSALTAGMPTILAARFALLVVRGASKREILRAMLEGAVSADLPASYLREHPNALLLADTDVWPFEGRPS